MTQLFDASPAELDLQAGKASMADRPMGQRGEDGRYKMPLLPGEEGTKAAALLDRSEQWVPRGTQSMTNLAASISDTRALGIWQMQQLAIGYGKGHTLRQTLAEMVAQAEIAEIDFQALKEAPHFRDALDILNEEALTAAGANRARDEGTRMHDVWEQSNTSQLFTATDEDAKWLATLNALLDAADFEVIPELSERAVRNFAVQAAGRFDNILMHRKTGKLYMADLKTKKKPFWGFLEVDGQLSGYAHSEYMLTPDGTAYEGGGQPGFGPIDHVDLERGVVLHMPSKPDKDGSQEPRLRVADLRAGWETMKLARRVCQARSAGQSAQRMAASWWPVG